MKAKQVVVKSNLPSSDFVINPYVGCTHGCHYCYASFMRKFYNIEDDWGSFVYPKIFEQHVNPSKYVGKTIVVGSVTDAYQPIEAKTLLTRSIIEQFIGYDVNLEIITKSPLVTRDIDLFQKLHNVKVSVSIFSNNDLDIKMFEAATSNYKTRVRTLQTLHEAGIKTNLFLSPIIPYVTNVLEIIREVSPYVDEVTIENINLNNSVSKSFRDLVYKNDPEKAEKILSLVNDRNCWDRLEGQVVDYCQKNNIQLRVFFHRS